METIEFEFDKNLIYKFANFEQELYPDMNNNAELTMLQLSKNYPVFKYITSKNFMILEDNKVIFRASAIINPHISIENSKTKIGLIGFFECKNNYDIFLKGIDRIINFFKQNGINKIIAPMNFNTWHKYRFVTEGFNNYFPLDIQTKDYYPQFFEKFGFKILKNYYSNIIENIKEEINILKPKYQEIIKNGYTFRKINKNKILEEYNKIYKLSIEGFNESFLYDSIDFEEFIELYKPLEKVLGNVEVIFIQKEDKEKGFLFSIATEDLMIFKSMAISKDNRNMGLGSALFYTAYNEALKKGIKKVIHAFMREDNKIILKMSSRAKTLKKYGLYTIDL